MMGPSRTRDPRVGDLLELVVKIGVAGRPIAGPIKVTATLFGPEVAIGNVVAEQPSVSFDKLRGTEPDATAAERGLLAVAQSPRQWTAAKPGRQRLVLAADGKGVFRVALQPQVPGIYQAVVAISGADSKIGPFTRTTDRNDAGPIRQGQPEGEHARATRDLDRRRSALCYADRDATRCPRQSPRPRPVARRFEWSSRRAERWAACTISATGANLFLAALAAHDDPTITLTVADGTLFTRKAVRTRSAVAPLSAVRSPFFRLVSDCGRRASL